MFQVSREQHHQDKRPHVIRQQERQIGLVNLLPERYGIPAETRKERDRREELLGLLHGGLGS